jgi:hypothetical protein
VKSQNFDDNAQQGGGGHRHRQRKKKAGMQQSYYFKAYVSPNHVNFPMGKGDHAQRSEYHGKSQCQQCVYAALGDSID